MSPGRSTSASAAIWRCGCGRRQRDAPERALGHAAAASGQPGAAGLHRRRPPGPLVADAWPSASAPASRRNPRRPCRAFVPAAGRAAPGARQPPFRFRGVPDLNATRIPAHFTGTLRASASPAPGVSIDPATGAISIAAGKLQDGIEVTVSAADAGRHRHRPLPPRLSRRSPRRRGWWPRPSLAGPAMIGTAAERRSRQPGRPRAAWRCSGAATAPTSPGATAASYAPVAADDRTRLACRVTASNTAGSTTAETAALAVTHAAPSASRRRSPTASSQLDSGSAVVEAAAGLRRRGPRLRGRWGGGDASTPATGRVSLPTDDARHRRERDGHRQQLRRQRFGRLQGSASAAWPRRWFPRRSSAAPARSGRRSASMPAAGAASRRPRWRCSGAATAPPSPARRRRATRRWRRTTGPRSPAGSPRRNVAGSARGDDRGAGGHPGRPGGERHARRRRAGPGRRRGQRRRRRRPSPAPA